MADVWVEAKDPKSGRSYYFNKTTKQTTWVKPAEMGDGSATAASPAAAAAPAAATAASNATEDEASFWKEGSDPKTGRVYYYNKKTKETTWKRPACLGEGPANATAAAPAAATAATATAAASAAQPTAAAAAAAAPAAANPTSPDDPANWRVAQDPRTGKSYWYNKVTKKTTWKNPFEEAEPEKPAAAAAPATATAASGASAKQRLADSDDDDLDNGKKGGASDDDDEELGSAQGAEMKRAMGQAALEDEKANIQDEEEDEHEFRFAKHRHGWFNRTFRVGDVHDETALLTFKKSLIKKALLKQNRELDEQAVQCFKNIMSYMGDRKSSKPQLSHAKKLLTNLMGSAGSLRDEAYMQLCKQTTQNPRVVSTIKGWELMLFCIATFPPSKHLKAFLMEYIKKAIKDNAQEKITALAEMCLKQLPKIVLMGQRRQVPAKLEMECLIDMKPVPIRVLCCNGSFKTFMVDSYTLVKEVEEMLVQKYGLTCSQPFSLFEQADVNQERILDPKDRILDVMAAWENRAKEEEALRQQMEAAKTQKSSRNTKFDKHKDADKKVEYKVVEYKDYLYKAKLVLKTSNKEIMADPEAIKLIYLQAVSDVVTNRYPSNEKDITVLAALQLQATHGDYKKDIHVPGWLAPRILECIPKHLVCKKGMGDKVQDTLVKEWEVKILAKYQKVAEFTSLDAKLNYLDYVQEWTFYGASFFTVEQRQFKDYPSPLTLGINCEGVLLMHPEKKTVLENYQFTDIVTWGHSDEKFIVVVGNIVQQRKLIFKTTEGKHMNHLIHDYVKFKVKAKAT